MSLIVYSTASRALHPEHWRRLSEDVVRRVREAAEELGYQPNAIAAGLRTSRSRTIGVLVPDLSNAIFPPIFRGIEDRAALAGYVALLANSDFDASRERRNLDAFLARQIDGLIMATTHIDDPVLSVARAHGIPVVSVMRSTNRNDVPAFVGDTETGFNLLVTHLRQLGHRNIGGIVGPQDTSVGVEQAVCFREAVKAGGQRLAPRAVTVANAFSIEEGRRCARALLSSGLRPTAIVAGGDLLALGCLDVFAELGIQCPQDISLTGYNDMPHLARTSPPLTTIRLPFHMMGELAMGELLARIDGETGPGLVHRLPVELIVRQSTAAPSEHR